MMVGGMAAWSSACSSSNDDGNAGTDDASTAADGTSDAPLAVVDAGAGDAAVSDANLDADANDSAVDLSACADAGANQAPQTLECTGLYASIATKTVAAANREYAPAHPLWSDNAVKTRWFYLPPGTQIDATNMNEWVFPVGTKFWKEFVLDGKRVETRFLWKTGASNWVRTTYRWNVTEDAATRLDDGQWAGPDAGAPDAGNYEIPAVARCNDCHNGRIDKILGFEAINLGVPGATGVTLADLVSEGLLKNPPATTSLAIPDDGTGYSVEALGWLHTNCGVTCHSESPGAMCGIRGMRLRLAYGELAPDDGGTPSVAATMAYTTSVNVPSSLPDATYMRIAPGDVDHSAISYLAGHRGGGANNQMPPIVSHIIDGPHVDTLNSWINALQ